AAMPSTSATKGTASAKPLVPPGEQSFELTQFGFGRVVLGETGRTLQETDDRIEGAGAVIWRAVVAEVGIRLSREALAQRLHDPRFADPGSPEAGPPGPHRRPRATSERAADSALPRDRPAGVRPPACRASKRPSARPSPSTRHAASGFSEALKAMR